MSVIAGRMSFFPTAKDTGTVAIVGFVLLVGYLVVSGSIASAISVVSIDWWSTAIIIKSNCSIGQPSRVAIDDLVHRVS